jgi:F-type H+-transporting ATPase subunit b
MEFLGNLGIDVKLLVAQIINFGLLLWLLTKFLYRPIIKRIEKDETELKQAQIQNKELGQQKNAFAEQKKKEIAEAKKQAREIIKEAENIAKEIKKRVPSPTRDGTRKTSSNKTN